MKSRPARRRRGALHSLPPLPHPPQAVFARFRAGLVGRSADFRHGEAPEGSERVAGRHLAIAPGHSDDML